MRTKTQDLFFLYHLTVNKDFRFFDIKTKFHACRAGNGQAQQMPNTETQSCPLSKHLNY